mmetsp:Transcript_9867/g.23791  ORF Transcript_9867/g.23791 Transcript_9867/m.23791 type:complete len:392 (+) Transcript_9867:25-1200(+)
MAADNSITLLPDKRLHCPVERGTFLGAGTSGSVWAIENSIDGRAYAVKRVPLDTAEALSRARSEVKIHASLESSAIVRYCYSWEESGADGRHVLNIVVERCDGELWDALCAAPGLTPEDRVRYSVQLLNALHHLQGMRIAHRDISPWNLWIRDAQLKMGDLGLAMHLEPGVVVEGLSTPGQEVADLDASAMSSLYSAPELGQVYDRSVDVFSAGMVLFAIWNGACVDQPSAAEPEKLTGLVEEVKRSGRLPAYFEKECPYAHIIAHMVSHNPRERPSTEECLRAFVGSAFARRESQAIITALRRGGNSSASFNADQSQNNSGPGYSRTEANVSRSGRSLSFKPGNPAAVSPYVVGSEISVEEHNVLVAQSNHPERERAHAKPARTRHCCIQ